MFEPLAEEMLQIAATWVHLCDTHEKANACRATGPEPREARKFQEGEFIDYLLKESGLWIEKHMGKNGMRDGQYLRGEIVKVWREDAYIEPGEDSRYRLTEKGWKFFRSI